MKLGNNRRTIVVTMSLMLVAGGVAFLALGASAHREGAFLANLKDLINGISGGNEQLSNLDTYIESEPIVFIVGGTMLIFLGLFGIGSTISYNPLLRKCYVFLLLMGFLIGLIVVILAISGHWGVDFNGEDNLIRERFRSHWLRLPRPNQTEFEARLSCCDFDNASPRRSTAVWLGGCRGVVKGCFIELLLIEAAKMHTSVFILSAATFTLLFFAAFNHMIDHAIKRGQN